jgi:hypothetical protein
MIDRALKLPFKDPIETYSSSDHVFTGLNIPRGVTGRLPKAQQTRTGIDSESVEDIELKSSKRANSKPIEKKPATKKPASNKPAANKPAAEQLAAQAAEPSVDKAKRNRDRRRTKSGELQAKP